MEIKVTISVCCDCEALDSVHRAWFTKQTQDQDELYSDLRSRDIKRVAMHYSLDSLDSLGSPDSHDTLASLASVLTGRRLT
jgi:hypothetical protein